MERDFKHTELTEKIIEVFYKVYNTLGYGFGKRSMKMRWQLSFASPESAISSKRQ